MLASLVSRVILASFGFAWAHAGDLSSGFVAMSSRALVHSKFGGSQNIRGIDLYCIETPKSNRSFVCTKISRKGSNFWNGGWALSKFVQL